MEGDNSNPPRRNVPEHHLGRLERFPQHKVVPVKIDTRTIGVLRKDDAIYAFSNRCPHHGGPMCASQVSGTMFPSQPDEYHFGLDGLVIKCPWHAYEFNVQTGESLGGVIQARLPVYQTDVRAGEVYCRLVRVGVSSKDNAI
jgi:nitrite reductase (NADH) small subunit